MPESACENGARPRASETTRLERWPPHWQTKIRLYKRVRRCPLAASAGRSRIRLAAQSEQIVATRWFCDIAISTVSKAGATIMLFPSLGAPKSRLLHDLAVAALSSPACD